VGVVTFSSLNPPYSTIVADPPWAYDEGFAVGPGHGVLIQRPLPYSSMSVGDIGALPVESLAAKDCRLFLWTTNRYLYESFDILRAWGFRYKQTLVWHKRDANLPGSVAPNSAEFILVGNKGTPPPQLDNAIGGALHHSQRRSLVKAVCDG